MPKCSGSGKMLTATDFESPLTFDDAVDKAKRQSSAKHYGGDDCLNLALEQSKLEEINRRAEEEDIRYAENVNIAKALSASEVVKPVVNIFYLFTN